ncbi:hypothetical protein BC833DRAFT_585340 [Globomyces pollinis-pini]|nr:hypothetical protein BC833DRAFT_585340 [Globomyces pollinis-pini]
MRVLQFWLWVGIIHCQSFALYDSMYEAAKPFLGYLQSVRTLWPSVSTKSLAPSISRGNQIMMYFRLVKGTDTGQRRYTGVYYPTVDDYTEMSVPNSWDILDTLASGANYANVSLIWYVSGKHLELPYQHLSVNRFGQTFYVPGRTALVTVKQGEIVNFEWAPTQCILSGCNCVNNICSELCPSKTCNATVRLAWQGTDASGNTLSSYARDIYRMKSIN